jgi:hypothetical protein
MQNDVLRPLLRWDGLHLVVDVETLEKHLGAWLARVETLDSLRVTGQGDLIRIMAVVIWKGMKIPVECDVTEIRLRNRHLGFRLRRVSAARHIRAPLRLIESALASMESGLVTVIKGQGIVLVDLRRWIAQEASLSVITVQLVGGAIHIWMGPGSLSDLPRTEPRPLPAGEAEMSERETSATA